MLELEKIKKIDTEKMYQVYDDWPKIAEEHITKKTSQIDIKDVDHIVFVGMGGSGTIGDILSSVLSKTEIHCTVVKGYVLPKTVDKNTLVVSTSISGNTDETLSITKLLSKNNCHSVSFSSGGLLEKFSKNNNLLHYNIEKIHSPRASLIGYLFSIINVLNQILPITHSEIDDSLSQLKNISKKINTTNLSNTNTSLQLAYWIKQIPLIYYPAGLHSSAIRFKNSLQENSKSHVIIENVIETCHNGIVSWEKQSNVQPILLQGMDDNIKTIERWKILKDFFEKKQIDYFNIFSVDGGILSKIICLIYQFDFVSIYNAVINDINPTPVNSIDFIKSKLRTI